MNRSWSLALLLALTTMLPGCITLEVPLFGTNEIMERTVFGEGDDKVLMLEIDGAISTQGETGTFGVGGRESIVSRVRQYLELAEQDDQIKALLLRIDSPGGSVIASEILYGEVMRFKQKTGLPVVAQMMGVAASGGYYVAMAADEVRAYPSTVTGSIGVVMAGLNLKGLLEKVGVENQTLTTGAFKDAGSPLRDMRPEERAQLQTIIEDMFQSFLDVVDKGRPDLDRAAIEKAADGRIYSARQAKALGLIDEVGDLPEAIEAIRTRAGLEEDVSVIVYHRGSQVRENLFSNQLQTPATPDVRQFLSAGRPNFLYLWSPWGELQ